MSIASVVFERRFCLRSRISVHHRFLVNRKNSVVALRFAMVASDVGALPGAGRDAKPVVFTTPPKDKKLYRRVTLQNGLLAILISDPEMANQTGGGSESEADMSEDASGSEDESDEVLDCVTFSSAQGHVRAQHGPSQYLAGHAERGRGQCCTKCSSQEGCSSYGGRSWQLQRP